ncbi:hypothetical protein [Chitinophaga skermanii]|nr:hypothetical protein [Chitinophaga skermanii]
MMFRWIGYLLCATALFACNTASNVRQTVIVDSVSIVDNIPGYDVNQYPYVLTLADWTFHEDEFESSWADTPYVGIYKQGKKMYLDTTRIYAHPVRDELRDFFRDGHIKSAWRVTASKKEPSIVLMPVTVTMKRGEMEYVDLTEEETQCLPGDSVQFMFHDKKYTLKAQLIAKQLHAEPNYQLSIHYEKDDEQHTQVLINDFTYEECNRIYFAGDIDNDALPDFLINTSNVFNTTVLTLYLSSAAEGKDLLKVMGMLLSSVN